MNPILQQLHQAPQQAVSNNPMQMLQQFSQFKRQMQGRDPRAMVEDMLRSGKLSPVQFEQLKAQASQLQNILK